MSVRIRAILVLILTNLIIILFSVFSGIAYVSNKMQNFVETDMMVVADVADRFISAEMELLKLKASNLVNTLAGVDETKWSGILTEQEKMYPDFLGMVVLDDDRGLIVSTGNHPALPDIIDNKYIQQAFGGKTVFTSTHPTSEGVVLYLAVPVPGYYRRVLALTIPGLYFSERLSKFVIWESGHIFIDDSDGYVISNIRSEWIQRRFNFILMSAEDNQYMEIAAVIMEMIQGKTGIGRFSMGGVPRICAYRPVSGSEEGWCLGVVAPLPESPARDVHVGLILVGLIGLCLSVIAAIIASSFIKKPFEEVAALKEEAEANSKSKSNFLANMSHEMRTPLNAVIGLSELILDGNISGEERDNIEKVYTSGVTLLGIINDILDISKIESGKFDLNPVEYDLPSLINDAITLNIMRIDEKPIQFELTVDETIPARLFGDDLKVKQIFNNILSNAFKYTNSGKVQWHLSWEKSNDDIWLVSSVKDTGIGIKPEDMSKLFLNYSQVDMDSHRKIEGTGLGLALTKRMVEMMEGEINVDSTYGAGSTFSFRIKQGFVTETPIGRKVTKSLMEFQYIDQKKHLHSKLVRVHLPYARVLVVDDVPTNLTVVRGIMKPYGMQVDCVTSGEQAIKLIRDGVKYNAIFMDHMMPEMDGVEAARIIRNDIDSEYAKTVPIIALTANAIRGNEEMFLNSGFQAFLSKPIDITLMDAIIRQWVRDKEHDPVNAE